MREGQVPFPVDAWAQLLSHSFVARRFGWSGTRIGTRQTRLGSTSSVRGEPTLSSALILHGRAPAYATGGPSLPLRDSS